MCTPLFPKTVSALLLRTTPLSGFVCDPPSPARIFVSCTASLGFVSGSSDCGVPISILFLCLSLQGVVTFIRPLIYGRPDRHMLKVSAGGSWPGVRDARRAAKPFRCEPFASVSPGRPWPSRSAFQKAGGPEDSFISTVAQDDPHAHWMKTSRGIGVGERSCRQNRIDRPSVMASASRQRPT